MTTSHRGRSTSNWEGCSDKIESWGCSINPLRFVLYNDKKDFSYTGLNSWELLNLLLKYKKKPSLCTHVQSSQSPFQHLLVRLMQLRRILPGWDLVHRFSILESTIRRILLVYMCTWGVLPQFKSINNMTWGRCVKEDNAHDTPQTLRKMCGYCFKIFIDCPINLLAWAPTYSFYKHHHTVKYLFGVTLQATVNFIFDGWGGSTIDESFYTTEHSTLFSNLVPTWRHNSCWPWVRHSRFSWSLLFMTSSFHIHNRENWAGRNCCWANKEYF